MDTTPEEEANPVLVAFQKITTQLKQLEERDIRAEERERTALERERALIFQYNQSRGALLGIEERANKIQQNIVDEGVRNKKYLDNYFKALPEKTFVVHEHRWSVDKTAKQLVTVALITSFISGLLVYFASPHVDIVKLDYQANKIEELNAKLNYMVEKNPKTAKNYEEEKEK